MYMLANRLRVWYNLHDIYTLTIRPQPPFATLDAAIIRAPTMTNTPPKVHVCVKPVALRIWPEMGVPISRPTETTTIKR
jgi:hypothetical protein